MRIHLPLSSSLPSSSPGFFFPYLFFFFFLGPQSEGISVPPPPDSSVTLCHGPNHPFAPSLKGLLNSQVIPIRKASTVSTFPSDFSLRSPEMRSFKSFLSMLPSRFQDFPLFFFTPIRCSSLLERPFTPVSPASPRFLYVCWCFFFLCVGFSLRSFVLCFFWLCPGFQIVGPVSF